MSYYWSACRSKTQSIMSMIGSTRERNRWRWSKTYATTHPHCLRNPVRRLQTPGQLAALFRLKTNPIASFSNCIKAAFVPLRSQPQSTVCHTQLPQWVAKTQNTKGKLMPTTYSRLAMREAPARQLCLNSMLTTRSRSQRRIQVTRRTKLIIRTNKASPSLEDNGLQLVAT